MSRKNIVVSMTQLFGWLYLFLVSIALIGDSFKLLGGTFAEALLGATSDPLIGMLSGLLATSICQSSSTTTSLVVGLVASGTITLEGAIPIIMGANIGTTVTCMLVAMAHTSRSEEFRRAFAAATVHDFFNLLSVALFLPLEVKFGYLHYLSSRFAHVFASAGGLKFASPIHMITAPAVDIIQMISFGSGWVLLIAGVAFLFLSLRYLVVTLKALLMDKASVLFDRYFFGSSLRSMALGFGLTVMVQSSSITTSLAVPLAGAGVVSLRRIFPFTMGANVGTTFTALLAALSTGNETGVAIAFAHLFFNISGIAVWWPLQFVPCGLANGMSRLAMKNRMVPVLFLLVVFFGLPLLILSIK